MTRRSEPRAQPGDQQSQVTPQYDDADIDASWPPPRTAERSDGRRRLPRAGKIASVILAITLVIGGIWALGGFKVRTDGRTSIKAGQLIKSGPFEFTFTHATAQRVKQFDDSFRWTLIMEGTGRTIADESNTPETGGNGMFVAKDPLTVETTESDSAKIGNGASLTSAANFNPGLAPVLYQVEFTFSERYEPSKDVQFSVNRLEHGNNYILDTGQKTWHNGRDVFVYRLPVTVLPPDLDD